MNNVFHDNVKFFVTDAYVSKYCCAATARHSPSETRTHADSEHVTCSLNCEVKKR